MANPIEATPDLDIDDWNRLLDDLKKSEPSPEKVKEAIRQAKERRKEMMRPKTDPQK